MAQAKRRRRRRRLNPNFLILLAALAAILVLVVCLAVSCSGPEAPADETEPSSTEPEAGWQKEDGKYYYLNEDGSRATGWLEADGKRYLLDAEGFTQKGWVEDGGNTYYLLKDGSVATGTVQIDGVNHHFTSAGLPILVVNPWNAVPEGYAPDLVELSADISVEGSQVDRSCYDALMRMIKDCNKECPKVCVVSSYRTHEYQTNSYNRKVQYYLDKGYTQADAEKEAAFVANIDGHRTNYYEIEAAKRYRR